MYANAEGVSKDLAKARAWYEKAAVQGHAKAQNNLGVMYGLGQGVAKDLSKAREWFEKAATQNKDAAAAEKARQALDIMSSEGRL